MSTFHLSTRPADSTTFPSVRNAYMLVNFGDFVDGREDKVADPYIQLLPTTDDLVEAHNDFVQVRLKGIDSTTDQMFLDTFTPSGPPDVRKSNNDDSSVSSWLSRNKTVLIAVGASVGGVLLITIAALCFCKRKTNVREKDGRRTRFMQGVPVGGKKGYSQLHEPAPSAESYLPHSYGKV
jgi:hypothetical protein